MNAIEVLQEMKENLYNRGWCQGALENKDGNVCLSGSMTTAEVLFENYEENRLALDEVVKAIQSEVWGNIPAWNDEFGRTFTEVVDLLDRIIIKKKEEQ